MENPREAYKLLSEDEDGARIGRDPRKVSQEEFHRTGHIQKPIMSVIREKCLDCCCGNPAEVRRCMAVNCDLWPYRMGTNPLRDKREYTDEERAEMATRLMVARKKKD